MSFSIKSFVENEKWKFILIKDNLKTCGRDLFYMIVTLLPKEDVNYVMYDHSPQDVPPHLAQTINIIDAFSDTFLWKDSHNTDYISINGIDNLPATQSSITVIDTLSTLLIHNSVKRLYYSFHKMLSSGRKLVSLLHEDSHSAKDCRILESLANVILELRTNSENVHYTHVITKSSKGKVSEYNVSFEIDSDYKDVFTKDMQLLPVPTVTKKPDPTANLTFNLSLNDAEKESRKNLQLPFEQISSGDSVELSKGTDFNEDDFYDDDDPDDDLDI